MDITTSSAEVSMSNPAGTIAGWLTPYMDPAYAALGGVIGTGVGMVMIVLAGIATAHWMEVRHESATD